MHEVGGKAEGLMRLRDRGYKVPEFVVFSSKAAWDEVLKGTKEAFDSADLLVVRSSAEQEDGDSQSFAGQFHSEVAVTIGDLPEAWNRVVASLPSEGVHHVIIQSFVQGDFSGVCFVDAAKERLMIDYLPGLCTAVVGGQDVHHLFFRGTALVNQYDCEKPTGTFFVDGSMQDQVQTAQMSATEIEALRSLAYQVSGDFGQSLDMEWTIKNGQVYLLQARPITKAVWEESDAQFYDSANVGESYGGIVLPLTISFAQRLYSQVYQDLLFHSGVPRSFLKRHAQVFDQLVDGAFGRMYYRMEHWYGFLSMLPGYARNKKNLEHMLLLQDHEGNKRDDIRPLWHVAVLYYPRVIWKLIRFGKSMRRLEQQTKGLLKEAEGWKFDAMTAAEAHQKLNGLFNGILRQWYLTVENDTVVLSLYASLTKKADVKADDPMLEFHSVSTEQVEQLQSLSLLLNTNAEIRAASESDDPVRFHAAMEREPALKEAFTAYFRRFGGRFANELKLETPGLKDDPRSFMRLVKLYAQRLDQRETTEKRIPQKAPFLVKVFRRFASRREVFRLYRAELFSVVRRLVLVIADQAVADQKINDRQDVFYLNWDELMKMDESTPFHERIEQRKMEYRYYEQIEPPAHFKVQHGRWPQPRSKRSSNAPLSGMSACKGKVVGRALVMPYFDVPEVEEIGILVTKRTDPGWTPLMALSKGLVVEHGGMLSHASIVARELGIPTVIGVADACERIQTGDLITVDGDAGNVLKMDTDEN